MVGASGGNSAAEGYPYRWRALAFLVIGIFALMMDTTILNVALRTIADPVAGLGALQADLAWIVSSYTLFFGGSLITCGIMTDRYGRKRILVAGLAAFPVRYVRRLPGKSSPLAISRVQQESKA